MARRKPRPASQQDLLDALRQRGAIRVTTPGEVRVLDKLAAGGRACKAGEAYIDPGNWFVLLQATLARDKEVDDLAPGRLARDPEPEKCYAIALIDRYDGRMLGRLVKRLHDYGRHDCMEALFGQRPPPEEPEAEAAALRAVLAWLERAPAHPRYATPKELRELRALRDQLRRAVEKRLRELTGAPAGQVIVWHGGRRYSIGGDDPACLNERDHTVLQAFLGDGRGFPPLPAMGKDELVGRSFDHAPAVLRKLCESYDGRFASAITLPGAKGRGGYAVRIRRAE
jgi:hypothetical protein